MSKQKVLEKDSGAKLVRNGNSYAVHFSGGGKTSAHSSGAPAWTEALVMVSNIRPTVSEKARVAPHAVRVARVR